MEPYDPADPTFLPPVAPPVGPPPVAPADGGSVTPQWKNPEALGPASPLSSDAQGSPSFEHPLRPLVALWLEKLQLAATYKKAKFGDDAEEAMAFFCGPYDFLYDKKHGRKSRAFMVSGDGDDVPDVAFGMTVNKVAEAVQIFGPVLYHRNPNRQVNPRIVPTFGPEMLGLDVMDPQQAVMAQQMVMGQQQSIQMDQVRANLLSFYLNYTPTELDLKTHCRRAIDEAIIKGGGLLWTEVVKPEGQEINMVGSFYDSVDHFLMDPDSETLEDAKWIARRCIHPRWQVEREYNCAPGTLRGVGESCEQASILNTSVDGAYVRAQGQTADLVTYWKIWSKMGLGARMQGAPESLLATLDQFGDYAYLVVAEGCPYPLNLNPDQLRAADPANPDGLLTNLDWPTPFWNDGEWPVTFLYFHEIPRCPWPMSHFKPAMGELQFLNWVYSFIAGKIKNTCRDFLAVKKSLGEELKQTILRGQDLSLLEIENAQGTLAEVIAFLQHPQMNGDIWKVIEAVTNNFEKRTGLTELIYGETAVQMRSAAEADLKGSQLQIRPDDMQNKVEDAMSLVARKEAMAARWHLKPQDVAPCMGQTAAAMWGQVVLTQDVGSVGRQLEYRIEAGSTRKPNKARDAANMKDAVQLLFQPLMQYAQVSGNVNPVNALMRDWCKSIDLDPTSYMLTPPPPPPPEGAGPQQGGGQGGSQSQKERKAA